MFDADAIHELVRAANRSTVSLPITRETLKTVERTVAADIAALLKNLNGNFKDVKQVSVLFSNNTGDQHNPTGAFAVVGVFGSNTAVARYAAVERQYTPWATFRVLELFEGQFQSYVEYPPVKAAEKVEA